MVPLLPMFVPMYPTLVAGCSCGYAIGITGELRTAPRPGHAHPRAQGGVGGAHKRADIALSHPPSATKIFIHRS